MAANVLNSPAAVRMSVFVVRAFIRMRELLSGSLAAELKKLEAKLIADGWKKVRVKIDGWGDGWGYTKTFEVKK